MTPWHLADLESSLVSACPGSSTDIPYTDCWGAASAGSHWDLCHIECPNSGAAVIASVSAGRRRAGTAWTHTEPCPGSFQLSGLTDTPLAHSASLSRSLHTYANFYRGVLPLSLLHTPGNASGVNTLALPTHVDIANQLCHSSPALSIASSSPLPISNTARPLSALLSLYLCTANMILAPTKSGCSFTNCLVTSR